ncbi:MAG: 3-deoxy-7-phosphoheptulonate synthase [Planctomycetes bacterium]|jgi:3-deoxy-7-phosphoheptulonate synthase|nr:3-deoxy-7-phosphoheptulonate synthase [Planctomycetota bacterium]HJO27556.1 3-deoxy-7-phosphoheptulonate synthase [Planctomycetota bacterium]
MLLLLQDKLPSDQLETLILLARELGYTPRFLDEERRLLELTGEGAPDHRARFEDRAAVRQVLDAGAARELHHRASGAADLTVAVREARFGGGQASLIAGPCAVENEERLLEIARAVRAAGATLLRGGSYKPRTSPYSFRGLGGAALGMLSRVRAETGLGIVTEVLDPRDVDAVAEAADMIQIGARSMTNSPLLREVARAGKPVLLKRHFAATVSEFLSAAETILVQGNERVILCERGLRGFDSVSRNLLDVAAVAHLKLVTHLPVIVDPSHAAGRPELVLPLARAGLVAGADGLVVEVHSAPGEVRSDGEQALHPDDFARLAREAGALLALEGRSLCTPTPETRGRGAAPSNLKNTP